MKLKLQRCALVLSLAAASSLALSREQRVPPPPDPQEDIKLPNGKSQRDEILKAEHEENIKDAGRLVEMAEDLKADLEKNDRFVLSLSTLKKTDDIEKLVKKIRTRMRH
ncbi:MAG TPA: hypothetical protein VLY04_14005 [Bryobacteraceae bacterium]|nr:hypothetical protein [Bryobacteraceae bacterium]